jgi:alkylation response protein AidB-like acyl-CoA dehydrogenase
MLYAEKVTVTDRWLGYLMDKVRDLGMEENTLFLLVSDHGEPMGDGEHGHGIMRKCRPWPYEELAHGDLSTALHIVSPTVMAYTVLLEGTDEQKEQWLPKFCGEEFKAAGSALVEPRYSFCPSQLTTRAVRDGDEYVLSGGKCYVPLAAVSENLLVFANTVPGAGFSGVDAFVVPVGSENLVVSEREMNMGLKALSTHEVALNDVRIPAANKVGGEKGIDFLKIISRSRLALAAMAVGLMRRAAEHSRD